MNRTRLKYLILILFGTIFQTSYSQENSYGLTLEYSPNYSNLTNEIVDENFKLSHNALIRILYKFHEKFKPTFGLGFLNTGNQINSDIGGELGIESIDYIYNYNYLYIPIGVKIHSSNIYFLPEVGLGINLSNKTKYITKFTNGETKIDSQDKQLNLGQFNELTIPMSLSIGIDVKLANISFSTGIKGYYGLNKVVRNVPRENHYLGIGIILAINF